MSIKPNPEKVEKDLFACGLDLYTIFRVTSSAEVLYLRRQRHLSCYRRYTRACLYVDKRSAVAGVPKSEPSNARDGVHRSAQYVTVERVGKGGDGT